MEMLTLDEERLKEHYAQLVDKPFFPSIAEFMMSGPSVIGIISGPGVIKSWRDMMGATNPGDAAPGTIRGDFATAPDGDMIPNIVHGSDSEESAAQEIKIWFGEQDGFSTNSVRSSQGWTVN